MYLTGPTEGASELGTWEGLKVMGLSLTQEQKPWAGREGPQILWPLSLTSNKSLSCTNP